MSFFHALMGNLGKLGAEENGIFLNAVELDQHTSFVEDHRVNI